MKMYYFNDRRKAAYINVNEMGEGFPLEPGRGSWFDLDILEDESPFIKVWENGNVLITTVKKDKLL